MEVKLTVENTTFIEKYFGIGDMGPFQFIVGGIIITAVVLLPLVQYYG